MVVVCESCSTRFQLDEARIPPKGTLVRCSRCKATFIVRPPSASFEETVQDVVAEATEAGGAPVPEPSEDLFDKASDDLGETHGRARDDEAWEFDDGPTERPHAPSLAWSESAPTAPRASEPAPGPVEELGSPEDWDLLGDSVAEAASEATFVEPEPVREAPAPAPVRAAAKPAPAAVRIARETEPRRGTRALVDAGRTALRTTAWLALAAFAAAGLGALVPGERAVVPGSGPRAVLALPDGEARDVRVRFVENAFAGTLFVVQGELARQGADPMLGLRVHFTDAMGARLGEGEWARTPPSPAELRERAPEALRAEAAAAPAEGSFAAIFEAAPAGAIGVALALEPLPAPAPADPGAGSPPDAEPAAAEPAPTGATASSPPSLPPSSE